MPLVLQNRGARRTRRSQRAQSLSHYHRCLVPRHDKTPLNQLLLFDILRYEASDSTGFAEVTCGVRYHRGPQRKNAENHSEKHSAALRLLRGSLRSKFLFEEFNPANIYSSCSPWFFVPLVFLKRGAQRTRRSTKGTKFITLSQMSRTPT